LRGAKTLFIPALTVTTVNETGLPVNYALLCILHNCFGAQRAHPFLHPCLPIQAAPDLADRSTDWVAIGEEAGAVKRRRVSVARRSCREGGIAIGDRDEKGREIEERWKREWSTTGL